MILSLLIAANPTPEALLAELVADERERSRLVEHLDRSVAASAKRLGQPSVEPALRDQIAANLIEKLASKIPMDAPAIERTVIDYELFKAEKFVGSGVFPKRYFGYFDEKHDTADYERIMRRTIRAGVDESNAYLEKTGSSQRITDMEVAITFIAEGGALMLSARGAFDPKRIHPVYGVGLDDIATGFARYDRLLPRLDHRLGTDLAEIVDHSDPANPRLAKYMTFEEAIGGTIVMWIYEKELAARKLANAEKRKLESLPVDEQFIFASLVYNSGLIFSSSRVRMIRDFATAEYLAQVSRDNEKSRWALPLFEPGRSISLLMDRGYPAQPTSWSAVYHILQRWGAYAAIERHTDVFDDRGRYRRH